MLKEMENDGQYKIELQTNDNTFEVSEKVEGTDDFDRLKVFKGYNDAKMYIKNREKRKEAGITKKKEPISAIYRYDYKYKDVKITSLSPSRYGGSFDVWVTFQDNKRLKQSFYNKEFFKLTDDNKKKIEQMLELRKKAQELEDSLESYPKEEIESYFKED